MNPKVVRAVVPVIPPPGYKFYVTLPLAGTVPIMIRESPDHPWQEVVGETTVYFTGCSN